ncbi:MAG: right-handed parallel beta-helix repeat-containing protein [Clostridia bacterium]|nr:right-handed parallel beta-helix repeat-containing protein [Clostridia bacterium]
MIRIRETNEAITDLRALRESILRFAESADEEGETPLTVVFDQGRYPMSEPLVLDANTHPALARIRLTMTCEDGVAAFDDLRPIHNELTDVHGSVRRYRLRKDKNGTPPELRELFADGVRVPLCRTPLYTHAFHLSEENRRINAENLEGIYIPKDLADTLPDGDLFPMEITLYMEWECFTLHALTVDRTRMRTDDEGNPHVLLKIVPAELYGYVSGVNKGLKTKNRPFYLANHPSLLTNESFCYHHKTGELLYRTESEPTRLEIPTQRTLFIFNDMHGVTLEHLSFSGTTDKVLCRDGYYGGQANVYMKNGKVTKQREAAILTRDGRRFTVRDCTFREIGTNAILMTGHPVCTVIERCRFRHVGMSAVSIGEPLKMWRAPQICSRDIRIENNLIEGIGDVFPGAPAIGVFRVDGLTIRYNTIDRTSYSAISVGWEWSPQKLALGESVNIRDAEISYNRITNFMQVLNDGGAIYVVGGNCNAENTRFFNFMHHNFARNEAIKRTVRGYYLDGSSSNWYVYDNVTSRVQRPVFPQFIVPSELTRNILVERTYSTEPLDPECHAPERNTVIGEVFLAPTVDALFTEYPQSKEIFDASGVRVPLK